MLSFIPRPGTGRGAARACTTSEGLWEAKHEQLSNGCCQHPFLTKKSVFSKAKLRRSGSGSSKSYSWKTQRLQRPKPGQHGVSPSQVRAERERHAELLEAKLRVEAERREQRRAERVERQQRLEASIRPGRAEGWQRAGRGLAASPFAVFVKP